MNLYNIAEQVKGHIPDNATWQEILQAVRNSYASAVKLIFYEGKQSELSELSGTFYYSFDNIDILYDENRCEYYSVIPSSYVDLPHSVGARSINFTGCKTPFWIVNNYSMFIGTKAQILGGNIVATPISNRFYFPTLDEPQALNKKISMLLAVALDTVDVDTELNIPPNVQDTIVQMCVAKFSPQPQNINQKV